MYVLRGKLRKWNSYVEEGSDLEEDWVKEENFSLVPALLCTVQDSRFLSPQNQTKECTHFFKRYQ